MAMKWSSATLYHLRQQLFPDLIENLPPWEKPKPGHNSTGLVAIFKEEFATPLGNSGCWFRIRISERKISKSELALRLRERLDEAADEIEADETNSLADKIREEVRNEIKLLTPPTHTEVDVMYRGDWFIICSATVITCDYITHWLLQKLEKHFSVKVASLHGELSELGLSIFKSEVLQVDNVELGQRVKVKLKDDTVVQLENMDPSPEVIELLLQTKEVKSLQFNWRGMKARVKEDLTLSGIDDAFEVGNMEFEQDPNDDGEYDDDERQFLESKARAELFAGNIPMMLKDIAIHCGDFNPLAEANDSGAQEGMDLSVKPESSPAEKKKSSKKKAASKKKSKAKLSVVE